MSEAPPTTNLSPVEQRAAFRAGWDAVLMPLLTAEWETSIAIAAAANVPPAKALERLKDMLTRGLVERRIVKKAKPPRKNKMKKRPRVHTAVLVAQFRLPENAA